jgi:hypothetical protein
MSVIDTKKLFIILRTHHGFSEKHREADLRGRLSAVAEAENTDPLTRKYLTVFVNKRLRGPPENSEHTQVC